MVSSLQLITHSSQAAFKECRKKYHFSYMVGLRPINDARALRMGSGGHSGVEVLGRGGDTNTACQAVNAHYQDRPEYIDQEDWDYERETVARLVCAYQWRWSNSPLEHVQNEFKFELPLLNPATGKPTPVFNLAGKIDAIVKLEDGRLAVKETKFLGEDIGPDSQLWRRLRIDQQISNYIAAARRMGYAVDTVLYDVVRKPAIAPCAVPLLDDKGIKIVLDSTGDRVRNMNKTWRQTGDSEKGYELQTRRMTVDEWGDKLSADIVERPSFYFARVEIARLDQDVDEFQAELWDLQHQIRQAQLEGLWYRTVGRNCQYCPYFSPCSENQSIDPAHPPAGFEIIQDVHPELQMETSNEPQSTNSAAPEAAATCATAG